VKEALLPRSAFRWWAQEKLRNADTDQFLHVNHAVLCTFFEAGRLGVFSADVRPLMEGANLAIVHLELDFLREVHFPGTVDIGTRVLAVGASSMRFAQALFIGDACVATAQAVCVLLNPVTHRARPVPPALRQFLQPETAEVLQ
jgi:acyl-CoA thioester hydrolase